MQDCAGACSLQGASLRWVPYDLQLPSCRHVYLGHSDVLWTFIFAALQFLDLPKTAVVVCRKQSMLTNSHFLGGWEGPPHGEQTAHPADTEDDAHEGGA